MAKTYKQAIEEMQAEMRLRGSSNTHAIGTSLSKPYGMPMDQYLKYRKEVIREFKGEAPPSLTSHMPLISLEAAMAELNAKQVAMQMREPPSGKTRRGKKNPEDRKPKGVPGRLKKNDPEVLAKQSEWEAQTIAAQQELLGQATTLMESYVMRIQVLELQVDELRALAAKVEELDDRVNWLET